MRDLLCDEKDIHRDRDFKLPDTVESKDIQDLIVTDSGIMNIVFDERVYACDAFERDIDFNAIYAWLINCFYYACEASEKSDVYNKIYARLINSDPEFHPLYSRISRMVIDYLDEIPEIKLEMSLAKKDDVDFVNSSLCGNLFLKPVAQMIWEYVAITHYVFEVPHRIQFRNDIYNYYVDLCNDPKKTYKKEALQFLMALLALHPDQPYAQAVDATKSRYPEAWTNYPVCFHGYMRFFSMTKKLKALDAPNLVSTGNKM